MTLDNYTRAYPVASSVEIEEDCGCGCSDGPHIKVNPYRALFVIAVIIIIAIVLKRQ